jgi:hypothetical protein
VLPILASIDVTAMSSVLVWLLFVMCHVTR